MSEVFDPTKYHGISFFDITSGRQMRYLYPDADHWARGWIIVQNPSGDWMTLRKATDSDLGSINQAVARFQHKDLV